MHDTTTKNEIEELKEELQRLADVASEKVGATKIGDAALALIAALDYEDQTLMDSAFSSLMVALAEVASTLIKRELNLAAETKAALMEVWRKYIDKKAYDITVFDEVKDKFETIIDERIAKMSKLRKAVSKLLQRDSIRLLERQGLEVKHLQELTDGIRDLRTFRYDLLKGWPSRKPPAPIDRAAITEAREAIRRGEKGLIKDELVWRKKAT